MDETKQYAQQQGLTLPHDVVKLPSGGIFYKSKKKSIKVGYLTASDENLLMAGNDVGKDGLVMTLLRSKIYETDLKPDELLQGDIQAILIFLRNTAFGPEYIVRVTDPETGKDFEATISLEELYIKKTDVQPNEDGTISTVLPKSGLSVKLKPLSFGELNDLDKQAESYPAGRIAPKQTWKLNKMIVEINGSSDKGMIAQNVESLPIADAKYIRRFIEENEPSLDLVRKVTTPSGKETLVNIVFGVEFFRPFF
jgi:hypothetical protein